MKNLFISNLNEKSCDKFTTDTGLLLRRKSDKAFKSLCRVFTKANIIWLEHGYGLSDEEFFNKLDREYISPQSYNLKKNKNNIIVERYPMLEDDEPYIFVCNHTCPEDIETVLNVIDRNAYLILGSVESLKYNTEMYLSFLNGMIPFDILDKEQRKGLMLKMQRVIKTNSILIFPEGSHNYSPNHLINPIYDGPVNLALKSNRKIVLVTMLKDKSVSYVDVSNPIDIREIKLDSHNTIDKENQKAYVNALSSYIRDKMATAVYAIMERHIARVNRTDDLEENLRMAKIKDAFLKLKWKKDVFEAEYLTKKTELDKANEEVLSKVNSLIHKANSLDPMAKRYWIRKKIALDEKDVVIRMRRYLKENNN